LRQFYARTLDLLVPQTAVKLVLRECSTQLAKVRRTVERLVGILAISGGGADHQTVARAVLYAKSQIARSLRGWTAELDEFAHKAIARRDTRGANEVVAAMGIIGREYMDTRRNSVVLVPDWDHPFAGGVSDIADVMNPIYDANPGDLRDATKAPSELVARQCVQTLETMATHAMRVVHAPRIGGRRRSLTVPAFT
jgi:hypothetical protein